MLSTNGVVWIRGLLETLKMDEESKSNDYGICIICQTNTGPTEYTHMVMNRAMTSVTRIIESAIERCGYGDLQFMTLKTRLQGLSAEDLISNAVRYHRNCYAQLTSKMCLTHYRYIQPCSTQNYKFTFYFAFTHHKGAVNKDEQWEFSCRSWRHLAVRWTSTTAAAAAAAASSESLNVSVSIETSAWLRERFAVGLLVDAGYIAIQRADFAAARCRTLSHRSSPFLARVVKKL